MAYFDGDGVGIDTPVGSPDRIDLRYGTNELLVTSEEKRWVHEQTKGTQHRWRRRRAAKELFRRISIRRRSLRAYTHHHRVL